MMNDHSMLGQTGSEQMPGMAPPEPQMGGEPQMQPGMAPPMQEPMDPMAQIGAFVDFALSETNLAKKLVDKEDKDGNVILNKMASELLEGYREDELSRQPWLEKNKEWLQLALLIRENKTYPWPKASNVKYPLIATAAMQFSARAYPALVPQDGKIVKARVVRKDKQGIFQEKAVRVAIHMSYQVKYQIPNWEEEMDKLLMTMAVSGIVFKKTWHDSLHGYHRSELVWPENFCVNYYTKSLDTAYRKTEILEFTENEIKTKVRDDETFLDIEYGDPVRKAPTKEPIATGVLQPATEGKATPHRFLAVHTYWDLDEDGYEEPYIVTIHEATEKVVRIIARWDAAGVKKNAKGEILHIEPVEYFTDFPFIPNPDGSIYACGFGMLLGPLNEAINTNINQLIDAGTLNNMSGGFVGKHLRIKMGQMQIRPGQWTAVNATGDDMKNSFFPIPTKEPSPVLMNLLNMMITSGNQLASIAEIMVGKMPGQNTPATTTQETVNQSMAVFTAIYKRVYRSLEKEFKKIFRLNRITPNMVAEEAKFVDEMLTVSDYEGTEEFIIPGADPAGDSAQMKQQKMQGVMSLMQMGTLDPMACTVRFLDAMDMPNYQELIAKPQPPAPPPPDPKMMLAEAKMAEIQKKGEIEDRKAQVDMAAKQQDVALAREKAQIENEREQMKMAFQEQLNAMKLQGEQAKAEQNAVLETMKMHMKQSQMQMDARLKEIMGQQQIHQKEREGMMNMRQQEMSNQQTMRHTEQSHQVNLKATAQAGQQKMQQARQQQKMKAKPNANRPK